MPSHRRHLLSALALAGSTAVTGCSVGQRSSTPSQQYKLYVRNNADVVWQEFEVKALGDDGDTIFTGSGSGLGHGDSERFGPLGGKPASFELDLTGLGDHEDRSVTEAYRPPDSECDAFILSKVFITGGGSDYDVSCSEV